jgi:hypothetical protein
MQTTSLPAIAVLVALAPLAAADFSVPLTVVERNGVERVNEPITCGVPFPKGTTMDAQVWNPRTGRYEYPTFALTGPDGKAVPAACSVAARWHPDRFIKWLHVTFQPTVKANGTSIYTLRRATSGTVETERLEASTSRDGRVTVTTGPLKFTVKPRGFNLFDEVWVNESSPYRFDDAHQMVRSHTGGLTILSSHMGLPKNKVYDAANDPDTNVTIEDRDSMRMVIKVTGKHVSVDDLPGPKALLDYVLRIYAYRGSTSVRVVYTVMNRQSEAIHIPVCVDGVLVRLPLAIKGTSYTFGRPGSLVSGEFKSERRAWVEATGSDRHVFGGDASAAGTGQCKSLTPLPTDLGWASLSDGTLGAGIGIQRFWQLWPKAVEVDADGVLTAHLWPNLDRKVLPLPKQDDKTPSWDIYQEAGKDYPVERALHSRLMPGRAHFFLGMSKTHELMFTFQSKPDIAAVRRAWYALERPLRAVCPTSWYCQETRVFGKLADSSPALYAPAVANEVQAYDARLKDWLRWIAVDFRAREYGKDFGVYDQYGMFDFGCSINYDRMKGQNQPQNTKPVSLQWDNNYYDFPHACILQWARTGDLDFLETAREADQHTIDVDMVCAHPDPSFVGAPRYCPGRMHICEEGTGIYVSDTYNHFKNLGHFDLWYLLGDHHFRDRGYMQADFVLHRGRSGLSQARSIGHGIRGALEAYRCGGDEKYLKAALNLVDYKFTRTGSGAWQDGIALEGFRELYEETGDERLAQIVLNGVEASMTRKDYAPAILHAYGFAAARTGQEQYRDVLRQALPRVGHARKMWGSVMEFGNTLRNAPYLFWGLSNLPQTEEAPQTTKPAG